MASVSEYAGREMSIERFADAKLKVEMWATSEYAVSDPDLCADICHLCVLAQGMWYNTRKAE